MQDVQNEKLNKLTDTKNYSQPVKQAKLVVGSTAIGMARVAVGFPFEHPLDSLRVQWQAQPWIKNEAALLRHVLATKGVARGLYAGAVPNLTRLAMRNVYKYPLLVGLPQI